jgi:ribosomal protein S18 acetylase RimI-like enzyme
MIKIVKAEEKHVSDIGKLWWEFMLFHQNIHPWFTPRNGSIPGFEGNQVSRLMKSEDGLALVALDRGKVIGYSLSEIRGPSAAFGRDKWGYVDDMAVTGKYRRRGVGEKMLTEIVKWFQLKNVDRVELQTAAQNVVANSFWQKQGFTVYMHTLYKEILTTRE